MLHPASSASGAIAWLWWFLFAVCTTVFLIVVALTAWAILLPRQAGEAAWKGKFIFNAGGVIPAIILFVILLLSVGTQKSLAEPETALTIRVTGHQWWWEVEYPDQRIITANELHIPVGQPVRLELKTADVIHSVWIPSLQGKTDMIPEKTNTMWIQADRPGLYRGQCAEYCGTQHALMALEVFALPQEEFDQWLEDRQTANPAQTAQRHAQGHAVFVKAECNNCHTIGTEIAKTKRGPNLTYVGSRRMLAAGTIKHTPENMDRWIRNPQLVKPGNLMPHTPLEEDDLVPLVEYLESLK